ncbi:MAG: folylpolyglutamate synthase/dihydrofolate synthase family protein [Chthoniobacterales bacterium]
MSYREALAWLYGTQLFGIKLGLENIQRLLCALRVPEPAQRIIHVAGTNGKGSVCAMIASICCARGHRTGLFTSPHLVTFRERIQVGGEMISETQVAAGLTSIREMVRDWDPHPTFFEIATALGLLHFRAEECEIVVLETGMGGRLDATNAVTPTVSVITPIDLDHQKWLGDTLAEIATEKAGIIKPGIPVVSAAQSPDAEAVIRLRAEQCGSRLTFVNQPALERSALAGVHQQQNAAVAIAACRAAGISLTEVAIREGLATVKWPARFQRFDERIVIDGAHNPAGARALAATWREIFGDEKATLIYGVLADKDAAASYRELSAIASAVILPQFRGERVLRPADLAEIIAAQTPELSCESADSVGEAIIRARQKSARILIAGSLHLAGEALAFLRGTPAAFEECAQ